MQEAMAVARVYNQGAGGRRQSTRHHVEMYSAAHRSKDFSSPWTAGKINLAPAQFKSQYIRNPSRNQYRNFMRVKSPYKKPR
jgi:hypothetical protein